MKREEMGYDKKQPNSQRLFSMTPKSHLQLKHVFHFLFFVIGLSLGIILCLYFKSDSSLTSPPSSSSSSSSSLLKTKFPIITSPPIQQQLQKPVAAFPSPLTPPPSIISVSSALSIRKNDSCYGSVSQLIRDEEERFKIHHNMTDEELFLKASLVGRVEDHQKNCCRGVSKVAFMFLTGGPLPLSLVWEKFFKGHEGYYSIYVHSHPSFTHDYMPETSVFHGRKIPSQVVYWGTATMIDAERRLLANALLDSTNQRFILLSDSCIPLFNFNTIYNHLINSNLSFLGSFDDPRKPGRGRYNPKMWPAINISDWRKGSQWFEIHRDLAHLIVSDTNYYPIFKNHCLPPCYMDEHYIPTVVNLLSPKSNSNRSVTWVDWSRGGPHPSKFRWDDITDEFLNRIRFETKCDENGGNFTSFCFLFARKFLPNALEPLLRVLPLLLGIDP